MKYNKRLTNLIALICEQLYVKGGVSAVTDYANKVKLNYGYCKPCEAEMPMIEYKEYKEYTDCACCGSRMKTIEKINKK